MAIFFTLLQVLEYFGVSFTITDSVFGSTFFMGTGLIILGPILFFINKNYFFSSSYTLFKNITI
jgi:heme/copper-type cytochrome/quinol oxidase subunit 3